MSDDGFFGEGVQERLLAVVGLINVDVDGEWAQLVERLAREDVGTVEIEERPKRHPLRRMTWLAAVAAAVVIVLMPQGRQAVERVTLSLVRSALEVVGVEAEDPAPVVRSDPTTTTAAPQVPTTQAPTTTQAPIPTMTTSLAPEPEADGHGELRNRGVYPGGIRQVHIQLNDAIGYNRSNFEALEGAPELVEKLIGQRPEFDARLRDTLGHLRQAIRARDRNAASAAHTIIYEIEQKLGTAGKQ